MNGRLIEKAPLILAMLCGAGLFGQIQHGGAGYWEGSIQLASGELKFAVNLAQDARGKWTGDIDIPAQNVIGWPLTSVAVRGTEVAFEMKGPPGDPSFRGTLALGGKSIAGNLTQGGGTVPFELKWVSEPKVRAAPAKSTSIDADLEGVWEGTLDASGQTLRLALKLSRGPDGTAVGAIDSLDQNARNLPVTTVTQKGSKLTLELKNLGASYDGTLSDDRTELTGEWSQGGASLPLKFKRASAKEPDKK